MESQGRNSQNHLNADLTKNKERPSTSNAYKHKGVGEVTEGANGKHSKLSVDKQNVRVRPKTGKHRISM